MARERTSGLTTITQLKNLTVGFLKSKKHRKNVTKIVGFFNNHYHGYAPENCLYMLEKLGLLSEKQKKAQEKSKIKQAHLSSFLG